MTREELDEILDTYRWVKVPKFVPDPMGTWLFPRHQYERLEQHHKRATEFLVAKVRELAREVYRLSNDNPQANPRDK